MNEFVALAAVVAIAGLLTIWGVGIGMLLVVHFANRGEWLCVAISALLMLTSVLVLSGLVERGPP